MENEEYRYELRVIRDTDYNAWANVSYWYFTNGIKSSTTPAGHSDGRMFPAGTVVLCRLKKGMDDTGKEGYFMHGFAKVTKLSESGRPIEFGDSLDRILGGWEPPIADEVIYDQRA